MGGSEDGAWVGVREYGVWVGVRVWCVGGSEGVCVHDVCGCKSWVLCAQEDMTAS